MQIVIGLVPAIVILIWCFSMILLL